MEPAFLESEKLKTQTDSGGAGSLKEQRILSIYNSPRLPLSGHFEKRKKKNAILA